MNAGPHEDAKAIPQILCGFRMNLGARSSRTNGTQTAVATVEVVNVEGCTNSYAPPLRVRGPGEQPYLQRDALIG